MKINQNYVWLIVILGGLAFYNFWRKNKKVNLGLADNQDDNAESQEDNEGTRAVGDRSEVMGNIFCPLGQYYEASCQCCKDTVGINSSLRMSRAERRRKRKYYKSSPRFW